MIISSLMVLAFVANISSTKKTLTPQQEKAFLDAFGMTRKNIRGQYHDEGGGRRKPKKIEIPDFLREQYFRQTGLEVDTTSFQEPGMHTSTANIVRSFSSVGIDDVDDSIKRFKFDFLDDPYSSEMVSSAVLKVLWEPQLSIVRKYGSFKANALDIVKNVNDSDITMLMDTKKIYHRNSELDGGWYTFDVTPAVHRWIGAKSKEIKGQLEIQKGKMTVKKIPNIAILPKGSFSDAYLLIYSEDEKSKTRTKRSSNMRKNLRKKSRRHKGRERANCKRHRLNVDFSEVGWNDWIVAPPGYDAHFCYGECPFPLADHLNGTNHAIVQTLVNSVNPSAVPRACCVPTELSPISMLYLDEYDKVVLKNYENMVVEGCGCR